MPPAVALLAASEEGEVVGSRILDAVLHLDEAALEDELEGLVVGGQRDHLILEDAHALEKRVEMVVDVGARPGVVYRGGCRSLYNCLSFQLNLGEWILSCRNHMQSFEANHILFTGINQLASVDNMLQKQY